MGVGDEGNSRVRQSGGLTSVERQVPLPAEHSSAIADSTVRRAERVPARMASLA